jgi:hypothetical protein
MGSIDDPSSRGAMMTKSPRSRPGSGWINFLRAFLVGPLVAPVARRKQAVADGLQLVMFGPFFGVPVMGNYYSLRLLPHFTGGLFGAKRRYLREKDFFDQIEGD